MSKLDLKLAGYQCLAVPLQNMEKRTSNSRWIRYIACTHTSLKKIGEFFKFQRHVCLPLLVHVGTKVPGGPFWARISARSLAHGF